MMCRGRYSKGTSTQHRCERTNMYTPGRNQLTTFILSLHSLFAYTV